MQANSKLNIFLLYSVLSKEKKIHCRQASISTFNSTNYEKENCRPSCPWPVLPWASRLVNMKDQSDKSDTWHTHTMKTKISSWLDRTVRRRRGEVWVGGEGQKAIDRHPGPEGQTDRRTDRHTHKAKPIHPRYTGCNYFKRLHYNEYSDRSAKTRYRCTMLMT